MRLVLATFLFLVFAQNGHSSSLDSVLDWMQKNSDAPEDGLTPGVYGQPQLKAISRYIPPGYLKEFDFDALSIEIEPTAIYLPPIVYSKTGQKYSGLSTISEDGVLESHVAGQPFTKDQILMNDSAREAGHMVAWNRVFRWQNHGSRNQNIMAFVKASGDALSGKRLANMHGGGHVFRHVGVFYHRVYFSNIVTSPSTNYRLKIDGSDELLYKEFVEMTSPTDLAGMKFVIERAVTPYVDDQVNSYLPTERRVRRLSAKERADSWVGSEMTFDDFEGFSGLVLDNDWRLLGQKVVLRIPNSKHEVSQYHGRMSAIPLDRWQLRKCFVVEAKPKWKGHPFGRRILFIDEQTYSVALSLIFDRSENLFKVINVVYGRGDSKGKNVLGDSVPNFRSTNVINLRDDIASLGGVTRETDYPQLKVREVRKLFSVSSLTSGR